MKKLVVLALLVVGAALAVSLGPTAAEAQRTCSQLYTTAHASCLKKGNSLQQCNRVIGGRKAGCIQDGCWRGERLNRCGFKQS